MRDEMSELGERIATQAAHFDAALHRLLTDIRAFDEGGGWASARSCAHWLCWRVGWDMGAAREHVRVARRLGELPKIDDALRRGTVSYSQVRAISRVATVDNEETLLLYANHMTGAQLEKTCRLYRAAKQETAGDAMLSSRFARRHDRDDGMVDIHLRLRPEEAVVVWAAIEKATVDLQGRQPDGVATQKVSTEASAFDRCDGVVALAQAYVRGDAPERSPIEIVVTTSTAHDGAGTGSFTDGSVVGPEALRRLGCDAGFVEVETDQAGIPLSVGRKSRSIPAHIKRALLVRDHGTCRFPGCTHRVFLEGHHIQHWADGGPTELGNLVSLCSSCHARVHAHGYRIELDEQQRPHFIGRDGVELAQVPPRPRVDSAWDHIVAENQTLDISAETHASFWTDERVDYEACVDGLVGGGSARDTPLLPDGD
jgi:hypothetical protein